MWRRWRLSQCLSQRYHSSKPTAHQQAMMARGLPKRTPIDGVQHVIAVGSGKGICLLFRWFDDEVNLIIFRTLQSIASELFSFVTLPLTNRNARRIFSVCLDVVHWLLIRHRCTISLAYLPSHCHYTAISGVIHSKRKAFRSNRFTEDKPRPFVLVTLSRWCHLSVSSRWCR